MDAPQDENGGSSLRECDILLYLLYEFLVYKMIFLDKIDKKFDKMKLIW